MKKSRLETLTLLNQNRSCKNHNPWKGKERAYRDQLERERKREVKIKKERRTKIKFLLEKQKKQHIL